MKIQQSGPGDLRVEWDDRHTGRHTLRVLRDNCPCASCKSGREQDKETLLPVVTPGKYELRGVEPVGSYALQLSWGDGHRTGIYTYQYLRYLCECEICTKEAVNR